MRIIASIFFALVVIVWGWAIWSTCMVAIAAGEASIGLAALAYPAALAVITAIGARK